MTLLRYLLDNVLVLQKLLFLSFQLKHARLVSALSVCGSFAASFLSTEPNKPFQPYLCANRKARYFSTEVRCNAFACAMPYSLARLGKNYSSLIIKIGTELFFGYLCLPSLTPPFEVLSIAEITSLFLPLHVFLYI